MSKKHGKSRVLTHLHHSSIVLLLIVRCVFVVFSYLGISRPKLWCFFGLGGPLDHFLHVVVGDLRGFLQVVDDGSVATDHRIADAVDVTFADGKQQIWVGLMSWPRRMRIVTSDSLKVGRSRGMSFPCPLEVLPFNASA